MTARTPRTQGEKNQNLGRILTWRPPGVLAVSLSDGAFSRPLAIDCDFRDAALGAAAARDAEVDCQQFAVASGT
jgi:hypothetical protein